MISLVVSLLLSFQSPALSPIHPEGAENLTFSPDSTMLAFTRGGNLWSVPAAGGEERQLTFDGSKTVYNGYASWVYYEEIFGRPSKYKAFWWSPDSKTLAFYRFDDTLVPMFPIYSPFGQDGSLRETHYPKAGEKNPEVRIGFVSPQGGGIVWADFDSTQDQYFGTPFWGDDSRKFFVPWEPRIQNTLDLYSVTASDGSVSRIYHEQVPTWLDWPDDMLFDSQGLYMVRSFESGWQQIYFLSYDGKTLRRLTDGSNWNIRLRYLDKKGNVYFTARRDSDLRHCLYKLSKKGVISALTDTSLDVSEVSFSPDGSHFTVKLSSLSRPTQTWEMETAKPSRKPRLIEDSSTSGKGPGRGQIVRLEHDGFSLPGIIFYPDGFDPSKKYPVHVDIYGGPDSPQTRDRWIAPSKYSWYAENGIIELIADCRAGGHGGRRALDTVYKCLGQKESEDFVAWAKWLQSLPYVIPDKIGVEGFSFGGTMTALLVMTHPEAFHYGIAGGGVYDWMLYDTHYTERFMSTPEDNPEGYAAARVASRAGEYKVRPDSDGSVMLRLTHGTGDDNVHFQQTLQLIDALQKEGAAFDFMIYPDGMHGYRGYQGRHFLAENRAFWLKYLKDGQ